MKDGKRTEHLKRLPDRLFEDDMVAGIGITTILYTLHVLRKIGLEVRSGD